MWSRRGAEMTFQSLGLGYPSHAMLAWSLLRVEAGKMARRLELSAKGFPTLHTLARVLQPILASYVH